MKTKIKLLVVALFAVQGIAFAQQSPIYTQYMFNDFVVNPAVAGTHDYYQIRLNNRYQWVGLKDAPITYTLSVYGPHKKMPMGWGGTVYSDSQGPTGKMGVYGSYGYNINIKKDIRISFGLSVGLIQYRIDMSKINFGDTQDENLTRNNYSFIKPDATFGVYCYATRYFGGISMDQLFGNRVSIERDSANNITFNSLVRHTTLVGGYKLNINRDFDMEPTLLFRISGLASVQMEFNAKAIWRKMAWGGISFRTSDAVVIMAGYNYKDQIYIGYSYDINYSPLRKFNSGSHEIMVGARFNKVRSSGKSKM